MTPTIQPEKIDSDLSLLRVLVRNWQLAISIPTISKRVLFGPVKDSRIKSVIRELLLEGGDWQKTKQALRQSGHSPAWIERVCKWGDKLKAAQ